MNRQVTIDLHTHTTNSDGELTSYELLSQAKAIGCSLIAITNHDTVEGITEARKIAAEIGIEFLSGIEISTQELEEVHILGLGIDETNENLRKCCQEFAEHRIKRAKLVCDFLATKGIRVDLEEVRNISGGTIIGRPHFAEYLVRHGHVPNQPEAFARFLNTPAFHAAVTRKKPSPEKAIELIRGAGGKAVLAHPGLLKKNWYEVEEFIKTLKEAGLDGVECIYQKHTPATEKRFLEIAKKYGLATSCGSDFHGIHVKPDVPLGMTIDNERLAGVPLIVDKRSLVV